MSVVKVTIEGPDGARSFTGDSCYVMVLQAGVEGVVGRAYTEPPGWENGMAPFLAAVEALKSVAEVAGEERHRQAARQALKVIDKFDPSK